MKIKVKIDEQMFEVEINDLSARPVVALVDGQCFEVWPEEESSPSPAEAMPAQRPAAVVLAVPAPRPVVQAAPAATAPVSNVDKSKTIVAPIPGVILTVAVCAGATVKVGQELCVLEAMKMKNAIRAPRDVVIGSVEVQEGQKVAYGDLMFRFA